MDLMIQEPVTVARTGPALAARIGLVGVAAAAIVAVGILAAGAATAPTGLLAADDTTAPTESALQLGSPVGGGPRFGHAFGGITITAIDGSNLSLETGDGWTRTINVDADTEYWKGGDEIELADLQVGDEIGLADLQVGDEIRFRQTLEDDETWSIDALAVVLPRAGGQVTAIDGSTITVERRDGSTTTIHVTDTTEFHVNGDDATLADVEVDMVLVAVGTENTDGSLTATVVRAADRGDRDGFRGPWHRGRGPGGPWFEGGGLSEDGAAS